MCIYLDSSFRSGISTFLINSESNSILKSVYLIFTPVTVYSKVIILAYKLYYCNIWLHHAYPVSICLKFLHWFLYVTIFLINPVLNHQFLKNISPCTIWIFFNKMLNCPQKYFSWDIEYILWKYTFQKWKLFFVLFTWTDGKHCWVLLFYWEHLIRFIYFLLKNIFLNHGYMTRAFKNV